MPFIGSGFVVVAGSRDVLIGDPTAVLTHQERQRADRLRRDADRQDFLASRVLARQLAASLVGGADWSTYALSQLCATCGHDDHGSPTVTQHGVPVDLAISWSRSSGVVAAAVAPGAGAPMGVDLEVDGPAAFGLTLAQWCRVEAAVKGGLGDLDGLVQRVRSGSELPLADLVVTEQVISLGAQRFRVCAIGRNRLPVQVREA